MVNALWGMAAILALIAAAAAVLLIWGRQR